ncbi:hypothetical protein PLIIFM63780_007628 [Purpureocillium lilacinum]|nr:hypothetical protein PLIIFM63780_007628 [Purpureocillium lilacinum]
MILRGPIDARSREFQALTRQISILRDRYHPNSKRSKGAASDGTGDDADSSIATNPSTAQGGGAPPAMVTRRAAAAQADDTRASGDEEQPVPAHATNTAPDEPATAATVATANTLDAALSQLLQTNAQLSESISTLVKANADLSKANADLSEVARTAQAQEIKATDALRDANERWLNDFPARLMNIQ